MRKELIGLFSGFRDHHFPEEIAARLREELPARKSLIFISAWPEEYTRNDEDADGMHVMFAEQGIPFEAHCVIDDRTDPSEAKRLVEGADCIFLMGGNATAQMGLIREKKILEPIRDSRAVMLGVSAGAMNIGKTVIDIWEIAPAGEGEEISVMQDNLSFGEGQTSFAMQDELLPYEGLGMSDITILSHYDESDRERCDRIFAASAIHPVWAMADGSAIFIKNGRIDTTGTIHYAEKGEIRPLTQEIIDAAEQNEFRKVFDTIPDAFDRYRPRYSEELFHSLIEYADIGPGTKVLELGPGTGQASEPVINTGCDYHAIELGEHLCRKMQEKYGQLANFHIVNDDFITHDFGGETYDLIYSAATIQWIPEEVAYGKTLSLLKPGGVLAMLLTNSEYRSGNEALYQRIQKLYDTYYHPDIPYTHGGFRYTAAPEYGFEKVEKREFYGKREFSAEEYVAFSGTHCDHIVIPEPERGVFFRGLHDAVEEAGGRIVFNDTYVLYLTRKPSN